MIEKKNQEFFLVGILPKSTVKKKNDEGDHGGSPLQDFVGAGPRACPDTPGPIRIGKF
jgi:hypothetical protein